jgi:isopropylmalate/isohomocitrate dehydrogenase-like protein
VKKILLIPGDGIGVEVVAAARSVLEALARVMPDLRFEFAEALMGVAALRSGEDSVPEATVRAAKAADGCLLGAIDEAALPAGTTALGRFRRLLGGYANIRPVKAYPGVPCLRPALDVVVVRENTEGMYSDVEFEAGPDAACAVRVITRQGSQRVARVAFELARARRRRVTAVHKLGVFKRTDGLFLESVRAVGAAFPEVALETRNIDACAMELLLHPAHFDVILATNMFGDILSDEAAGLVGGIGLAPSAVLGDRHGYFEPVHGTAPDIAGKGIANPIAAILAGAMMLDHLKEGAGARAVERAVAGVLAEGRVRTPDLAGSATTTQVAEAVAARLAP